MLRDTQEVQQLNINILPKAPRKMAYIHVHERMTCADPLTLKNHIPIMYLRNIGPKPLKNKTKLPSQYSMLGQQDVI